MDKEGEGRRTIEAVYKGSTANFASISLYFVRLLVATYKTIYFYHVTIPEVFPQVPLEADTVAQQHLNFHLPVHTYKEMYTGKALLRRKLLG
jgi:hypothetical protein